jgi:hypothetical protein
MYVTKELLFSTGTSTSHRTISICVNYNILPLYSTRHKQIGHHVTCSIILYMYVATY